MNIPTHSKKPQRLFLIAIGACLSALLLYCVFFALANEAWTVISTPTLPWRTDGPIPIFEARLWAIMLGAFASGACVTFFLWLLSSRRRAKLSKRIKWLENELNHTKKLLAVSTDTPLQGANHDDTHRDTRTEAD